MFLVIEKFARCNGTVSFPLQTYTSQSSVTNEVSSCVHLSHITTGCNLPITVAELKFNVCGGLLSHQGPREEIKQSH